MNNTLLRVEGLRVNIYGNEILRDISLDIKTGEQWAIFGEAGTGKTVLAYTLAGHRAFQGKLDHRLLSTLPAGIQRLVLLGRAMIKTPPLLILDEPCQGLDSSQTKFALDLIDRYCNRWGAGLIFVSHYRDEFPSCIRQELRPEKGKIV